MVKTYIAEELLHNKKSFKLLIFRFKEIHVVAHIFFQTQP